MDIVVISPEGSIRVVLYSNYGLFYPNSVKIARQRKKMELFNQNILLYLSAYLLAGIPFGYLLAQRFAGVNVKLAGSGNIGATNVLRVVKEKDPKLAKKLGAATLFLDATKGILIILIAKVVGAPESVLWAIGVLAVVGHCFSPFLNFEGGKGVATGLGVALVMVPYAALAAIFAWVIANKGLKIVALASLIGLGTLMGASYYFYPVVDGISTHAPLWIIASLIFYKHLPNLLALFNRDA